MDTAQWPQEIIVKPMEEIVVPNGTTATTTTSNSSKPSSSSTSSLERKVRPQKEEAVNCPRCNSINTKFCYYNNYSLSQPRYFCKTCRRYWTAGGSLRSIPVGGGSRKNKRSSSSSSSSISNSLTASAAKKLINLPDLVQASSSSHHQNPNKIFDHGQDLNLGFPSTHDFKTISELIQVPSYDGNTNTNTKSHLQTTNSTSTTTSNTSHLSALELLTGITNRGLNSFMPMPISDPNTVFSSGFSLPEFKMPSLGFSLDGIGGNNGYGNLQENSNDGRLLFPFEDLKQVSSTTNHQHDDHSNVDQSRDHQNGESNGYWNGMLGGGSW